jgi:hypothetical protein
MFLYDKKVKVKHFKDETLGAYNRPIESTEVVDTYKCMVAETDGHSNTSQLQPQKQGTTSLVLYTDPEAEIKTGDIVFIYELDEYDNIIESTELKAVADKPYKKRTQLRVPLLSVEEV